MAKSLADTRSEYDKSGLSRQDLTANPIDFFEKWYEAASRQESEDPNAFVLSTVDEQQRPDSRVLLLKGIEDGNFLFYTNYNSTKALEIQSQPEVAMLFFWKSMQQQVRIRGKAYKISQARSEQYFATRPRASQLGAWASDQSAVVTDRAQLIEQYQDLEKKYAGVEVPMPPYWGGYEVSPEALEFWQGRESRLHDRFRYTLSEGVWSIDRLSP